MNMPIGYVDLGDISPDGGKCDMVTNPGGVDKIAQ